MDKCVLCGYKQFNKLFGGKDWFLVRCLQCGLVKTVRERGVNYNSYYRDKEYQESAKQFENIFRKRLVLISKFVKKGRVLEIGCSTGLLLSLFRKKGWECWGIEPSLSGSGTKDKEIKVINGYFENLELPFNYFDVVILNHTLEHLENPLRVIKKVRVVLKDKGLVFIDVPNFACLQSKLMKAKWPLVLPYEHNFHFTKELITKLLIKSGFKVKYTETRSGIFDYQQPFLELWQSLISFKRRFFANVVGLPLSYLETKLNRGSCLTVIGQK